MIRTLVAALLLGGASAAVAAPGTGAGDSLSLDAASLTVVRMPSAGPLAALAMQHVAPARAVTTGTIPVQLTPEQRTAYRQIFAAIRESRWSDAQAGLLTVGAGPLSDVANAELMLAKGAPQAEPDAIVTLVARAPQLPEAAALLKLAQARGATALPMLPPTRDLARYAGLPAHRQTTRTTAGDTAGAAFGTSVLPLLKTDSPAAAEALLAAADSSLSSEARTEWQGRIAWSYFLNGDDAAARRLATQARGGAGDWTAQADWVVGLSAWRQADHAAAEQAFLSVSQRAPDAEMRAAGLFWAARADLAGKRPERVTPLLRQAARLDETFYGLLARESIGLPIEANHDGVGFIRADWTTVADRPNVRVAAALVEVGEIGLADQMLRQQARIGAASDHPALLRLAGRLGLPATQLWLARNGPEGAQPDIAARYPAPAWKPDGGWRVDRSLVYAHALQESAFRTDAVSRAGARGLMQVLPGTAQLIARNRGLPMSGDLSDPAFNIECGQSYLEQLRDADGTGGLLPKVIAAYNAGPGAVARWNGTDRSSGDPLLFIESIPYAETRTYVATVLRNYWMYQAEAGAPPASLSALAQGMWPRFPGMPGKTALRIESKATAFAAR